MKYALALLVFATIALAAGSAAAQCSISGNIEAMPNSDPLLPDWEYTLTVTWDTGTPYALSHLDLLIDPVGGTCSCNELDQALEIYNPAGSSSGVGGCTVPYNVLLECDGDPSIPGVSGILLKFEPIEEDCEPDTYGVGTFTFYSNHSPVPIDEDILGLVDKFAGNYCFGNVTGEFPGLACNPVPETRTSWGGVKGLYR